MSDGQFPADVGRLGAFQVRPSHMSFCARLSTRLRGDTICSSWGSCRGAGRRSLSSVNHSTPTAEARGRLGPPQRGRKVPLLPAFWVVETILVGDGCTGRRANLRARPAALTPELPFPPFACCPAVSIPSHPFVGIMSTFWCISDRHVATSACGYPYVCGQLRDDRHPVFETQK